MSDAVRRPCSDFMDMLRRLINYRIIIIIIIIIINLALVTTRINHSVQKTQKVPKKTPESAQH